MFRLPRPALLAGPLLSAAVAATFIAGPAHAEPWPGHPDRDLVRHVVRPGDTATGLAVRYHAWTDELIRLNRLGRSGALYQGQVVTVPVVVSAAKGDRSTPKARPAGAPAKRPLLTHASTIEPGWRHHRMSRTEIRRLVARMARQHGVPARLALAIAWQESGWQQYRVSSAGALGVMQVMPDTGRWMRWYAGKPLRLRDTHDNIQAGVLTLRTLRAWTRRDNNAIAAYYQGLGAVRERGWYDDTKRYVTSVRAIERRLRTTGEPI